MGLILYWVILIFYFGNFFWEFGRVCLCMGLCWLGFLGIYFMWEVYVIILYV